MAVYFVINYDISDEQQYAKYNPGSSHITVATVAKHGGEILVATHESHSLIGKASQMRVIIQFPTRESAEAWHEDSEYAEAKSIRLASTTNIDAYIVDKLVMA
jgi:uncharacterized protein (DUF1330 family)